MRKNNNLTMACVCVCHFLKYALKGAWVQVVEIIRQRIELNSVINCSNVRVKISCLFIVTFRTEEKLLDIALDSKTIFVSFIDIKCN